MHVPLVHDEENGIDLAHAAQIHFSGSVTWEGDDGLCRVESSKTAAGTRREHCSGPAARRGTADRM